MVFKLNPFTGNFDRVEQNFSYENIISGVTILVPENQQMTVHGTLILDGTLILNGTLIMRT